MDIYVWSDFDKRINSTLRPTGGTKVEGYYRNSDPLVITSPIIRFNLGNNSPTYKYCYIPDWNRYYYIKNWAHEEGVWVAELTVDVLASYKNEIGAQDFYITRASAEYDETVIDALYPATVSINVRESLTREYKLNTKSHTDQKTINSLYWKPFSHGCIVFGLYGPNSSVANSGVSWWICDTSEFYKLSEELLRYDITSSGLWEYATENLPKDYAKAIADPIQYFDSIIWFPFRASDVMGMEIQAQGPKKFGYYDLDVNYKAFQIMPELDNPIIQATFAITKHPQANERGKWLNDSPYTTYHFFFPPFGEFDIPSRLLLDSTTVISKINVDLTTGNAKLQLVSGTGIKYIGTWNGQFGVPISLSQMTYNPRGVVQGATHVVEGAVNTAISSGKLAKKTYNAIGAGVTVGGATGNAAIGMSVAKLMMKGATDDLKNAYSSVKKVVSGAADALESAQPTVSNTGSFGSFIDWMSELWPTIYTKHTLIVDEHNESLGRPLNKVRKPSQIPGFMVVESGSILRTSGTLDETNTVINLIESGFYYE